MTINKFEAVNNNLLLRFLSIISLDKSQTIRLESLYTFDSVSFVDIDVYIYSFNQRVQMYVKNIVL